MYCSASIIRVAAREVLEVSALRRAGHARARQACERLEPRRLLSSGAGADFDFGDAPDTYGTLLASNGPRHFPTPNLLLGSAVDAEPDGQPAAGALRDDLSGVPDDEDGIVFLTAIVPGTAASIQVTNGAAQGRLNAWIDFDLNGAFNAGEQIFTNVSLPAASVTTHTFAVPTTASVGDSYARFRLNELGGLSPLGSGGFGEVEDYQVKIEAPTADELDFGDAPDTYQTTLAVNGARHAATPNLHLGPFVDVEPDGQPSGTADRDDANGVPDDEDGIAFLTPLVPGGMADVQVSNGAAAGVLNAWLDFNGNGVFNPGEQILTNVVLPAASVTTHSFAVPAGATPGTSYARFRLAGTAGVGPAGPGGFGEVEDYLVRIDEGGGKLDFGDAPDSAAGGPFMYPTIFAGASGNPARHLFAPNGPRLGLQWDPEPDGQPNLPATGDDLAALDDEDGITVAGVGLENVPLLPGAVVPVQVTNTGAAGRLNAWFDWNQNGNWEAAEQVATDVAAGPGVTIVNVTVPAGTPPGSFVYSRFRLSTTPGLGTTGFAPDGEVEDYRSPVEGGPLKLDFGDAPDAVGTPFQYPTTFGGASGDPARHAFAPNGPQLGPLWDPEPDGQPTALASGDDANGFDDEDGITVGGLPLDTVPVVAGSVMMIEINNTGADGRLNAWFDWNENGTWEPAEQVATDLPAPSGLTVLPVAVPGTLTANSNVYSRFRINSAGGLDTKGFSPDGEVEDYRSRALPDTVPPTVINSFLEYNNRQAIRLLFSEPLNPATVSAADLSALNLDDGTTPVANAVFLSPDNQSAVWVFNTPGTFISDGDYQFTLAAGAVSDVAGNGLAAAFNLSGPTIFFFGGDANRDRMVTLVDFNLMAVNFGTAGNNFSQGNFNYDALGNVDLNDFNILAARFGTAIAPPAAAGAARSSPFADKPIDDALADEAADLPETL